MALLTTIDRRSVLTFSLTKKNDNNNCENRHLGSHSKCKSDQLRRGQRTSPESQGSAADREVGWRRSGSTRRSPRWLPRSCPECQAPPPKRPPPSRSASQRSPPGPRGRCASTRGLAPTRRSHRRWSRAAAWTAAPATWPPTWREGGGRRASGVCGRVCCGGNWSFAPGRASRSRGGREAAALWSWGRRWRSGWGPAGAGEGAVHNHSWRQLEMIQRNKL